MKNEKVMKVLKIMLSICKMILGIHLIITVWKDIHDKDDYED